MNVIIPDSNVILAAVFNTTIEGISIRDEFHDDSSQLLDIIKDEAYPNVKGILLPQVDGECRKKLIFSGLEDLHIRAVARKIVKKVAEKVAKERYNDLLQEKYLEIVTSDTIHVKYPRDLNKFKDLPVPVEIMYLRNLYCVLPAIDIDSKYIDSKNEILKDLKDIIRPMLERAADIASHYTNTNREENRMELDSTREEELRDVIKSEINNPDMMSNDLSITDEAVFSLSSKMNELKKGLEEINNMPKIQLSWHVENEPTRAPPSQLYVKAKFKELFDKYENTKLPLQLAEHKE
ncbi:MAG: hypothetical protein OXC46_05900 [Thaumarchaeota archaeon]|nr:hypothetical protein [Nitrososphaerota archaeon]